MKYFCNLQNFLDIATLALTAFIEVHTIFELSALSIQNMRVVASIANFLLVEKLFDWMRLFNETAFYA